MSNGRRHRRERGKALAIVGDLQRSMAADITSKLGGEYGMVAGWCAGTGELDAAKQATHDAVIEMLGDRRLGGVTWRIFDGPDECNGALDQLQARAAQGPEADHYRRLRAMVREYGGFIVMAFALGDRHGVLRQPKATIKRPPDPDAITEALTIAGDRITDLPHDHDHTEGTDGCGHAHEG